MILVYQKVVLFCLSFVFFNYSRHKQLVKFMKFLQNLKESFTLQTLSLKSFGFPWMLLLITLYLGHIKLCDCLKCVYLLCHLGLYNCVSNKTYFKLNAVINLCYFVLCVAFLYDCFVFDCIQTCNVLDNQLFTFCWRL